MENELSKALRIIKDLPAPVSMTPSNAKDDATVASIPDEELLRRAVVSARPRRKGPRWVAISEAFALGSTFSMQLCRRFGLDPDEQVKA